VRIFVAGLNGQLACELLQRNFAEMEIAAFGRPELDICDRASITNALSKAGRPHVIVNAAAYTAVDKAESDAAAAFAANRDGAANLAGAASEFGIPIFHVSTDYVFSGDKPAPYTETDETGPTGVYGQSKLEGERAVAAGNPRHLILRTAWVYSEFGHNFLKTMLRLAESRDELNIVSDQIGNPTHAGDLADAILHAAKSVFADPGFSAFGIYNVSGPAAMSWADFARLIFETSKSLGGPSAAVRDIPTSDYPTPAKRPANSRLDNAKFHRQFGWQMPATATSVEEVVRKLLLTAE
jgi:dTDP-4-dehydrorhamnose reductase